MEPEQLEEIVRDVLGGSSMTTEPVTKRRITWAELWKIRPDRKPSNDNQRMAEDSSQA